jgi:hypothetical protein
MNHSSLSFLERVPQFYNFSPVSSLSKYRNFGQIAFGDPCKPKPSKRLIRICPPAETSSSSLVNDSFESPHSEIFLERQQHALQE